MEDKFILLMTTDDTPIIIGVSNIATIEPNSENKTESVVTLNFARNNDLWPKKILVKDSFEEIMEMVGL